MRRAIKISDLEYDALLRRQGKPVSIKHVPQIGGNAKHVQPSCNANSQESLLAHQLDLEGIIYEPQFAFHPEREYTSDFWIVGTDLLVEVDGGLWIAGGGGRHQRAVGYEEDCVKDAEAMLLGYRVLRVTPAQVVHEWACTMILKLLKLPSPVLCRTGNR